MPFFVGCDVGSIGVKAAVVTDHAGEWDIAPKLWEELPTSSRWLSGLRLFALPYRRAKGDPLRTAVELLQEVAAALPEEDLAGTCITGSGGRLVAARLEHPFESEYRASSRALGLLYPDAKYLLEIGGGSARVLTLSVDASTGEVGIADYETNGDCAAGTGSFLDQQATRLRFKVEEVGDIALSAERAAKIAGRCSVFAKSDMIHAQQKGASPQEVLRGLCEAVARNFKANVLRGRSIDDKALFVGGVALNRGVREALREALSLDGLLVTPPSPAHYAAVGAALLARHRAERSGRRSPRTPSAADAAVSIPSWAPLDLRNVLLLRDRAETYRPVEAARALDAYLGLDVGSVSTNVVLVDTRGELMHEIYLRTAGRPVEAVARGLREVEELFSARVSIRGVGTTGSGRELIGELVGADAVHDEITAHKTGAFRIAERYLGTKVDTIFEVGGQDAKYIHLRDGVVVDFAMNEACAAGTGSFLEEQAEKLGVRIEEEFSRLALSSPAPARLGERCTVFMERDVARYQQDGAELPDLIAGLAYAVVQNYLNRVVRGRRIGDVIFFQGGTAYNDSVAAAFSKVLGKRIVVPPHNGVVGAYGAALLARDKVLALQAQTSFRGYKIDQVIQKTRTFACGGCANRCDIQEFLIDGRKSYWGDKCSEKYRREAKVPTKPVIADLLKVREEALFADYLSAFVKGGAGTEVRSAAEGASAEAKRADVGSLSIGLMKSMYLYERYPFWSTYLRALGFSVEVSPVTTKEISDLGVESAVSEPCYPIQVAHGHAAFLLRQGVDLLLLPNEVTAPVPRSGGVQAFLCPWGQTLPFVLGANSLFSGKSEKLLAPSVRFQDGPRRVEEQLWMHFSRFGFTRRHHKLSATLAYRAQEAFRTTLARAGSEALEALRASGQPGLVLVGRPYNLFDRGVNLNIPHKLRSLYGVNILPIDFLPLDGIPIEDIDRNMYWNYGKKILQAARFASTDPLLHLLYLTNFKCGPDSYVKQFAEDAAVKPFLVLQFDGHGNDAGAMTRCEAYLDSIGVLRWWQTRRLSEGEPCTSLGCATEPPNSSRLPSAA
jgi:predicted CoA-substrate-specific enzyme activase